MPEPSLRARNVVVPRALRTFVAAIVVVAGAAAASLVGTSLGSFPAFSAIALVVAAGEEVLLEDRFPSLGGGEWARVTFVGWIVARLAVVALLAAFGAEAFGSVGATCAAAEGALLGAVQVVVLRRHARADTPFGPWHWLAAMASPPAVGAIVVAHAGQGTAVAVATSAVAAAAIVLVSRRLVPWVSPALRLDGKVALVTGASSGIGRAVAEGLAARGCAVVALARSTDALARLVGDLDALAGEARASGARDARASGACDARACGACEARASGACDARASGACEARACGACGARACGACEARACGACGARACGACEALARALPVDLASSRSIDRAAGALLSDRRAVDYFVHAAGATFSDLGTTADGVERTLAVDALGPMRLTASIAPLFAPGARVVVLTGASHRGGAPLSDDPRYERERYTMFAANAHAQRARFVWVSELGRERFAAAVHPGAVLTPALRAAPWWVRLVVHTVARPAFVRAELGALPVLRLLLDDVATLPSGRFWSRFALASDRPHAEEAAALATLAARGGGRAPRGEGTMDR